MYLSRPPRAFTLVELLVVIGIIAILMGILLPSLQAARRTAMQAKCAANLQNIGRAFVLYAQDHKGFLPVAQLQLAAGSKYNLGGVDYPVATGTLLTHAMWPAFLARYIAGGTKQGMSFFDSSNPDESSGDALDARLRSVFWCPSWDGYQRAVAGQSDVYMWNTGYGMNAYLTMKSTDPDLPPANRQDFIQNFPMSPLGVSTGLFHRLSQCSNSQSRALAADGQFWLIEAKSAPTDGTFPGQKLPGNSATYSDPPHDAHQTLFDWYRHGRYPAVENSGTTGAVSGGWFRAQGGKVAYNILYCDGHVAQCNDQAESYRSIRQRFPG